ncbi:MAG: hypothetical protein Ct9H300mP3_01220 [Gammaproteobacteria bacterium]|nr:MAG: hypothetical protein Ct9H300mP3_01220 [Gammaproteobacteria bacterium]
MGWGYKEDGPGHLKVIGETEAVVVKPTKEKRREKRFSRNSFKGCFKG